VLKDGQRGLPSKLFRSVHTSFRHLALLLAIAALGSDAQPRVGAAEKKDKGSVIIAPPLAMPQKVTVPRGRKIDIPLRIYGRQREQLRYLIKTPPAKQGAAPTERFPPAPDPFQTAKPQPGPSDQAFSIASPR
jgi:hypothetical protein